jgi:hypothetical protein
LGHPVQEWKVIDDNCIHTCFKTLFFLVGEQLYIWLKNKKRKNERNCMNKSIGNNKRILSLHNYSQMNSVQILYIGFSPYK